jgi:hypothetical protein
VGTAEARNDTLIAAGPDSIVVMASDGDRTLVPPAGRLEQLAASAAGPFIVAAVEGGLLLWNLAEIQPDSLATWPPTSAHFAGSKHLVVADEGLATWRTLEPGGSPTVQELGAWPTVLEVATSPDEQMIGVIDGAHQAHVVRAGGPATDLGRADHAAFASAFELVLTTSGRIEVVDVRTNQRRTLLEAPVRAVAFADGWVAAALGDGTMWRTYVPDGTTARTKTTAETLVVGPNGTVVAAAGSALVRWTTAITPLGHAPAPVATLARVGTDAILAVATDGRAVLVTAGELRESLPVLARSIAGSTGVAMGAGLIVEERGGGIEVIDVLAQHRWPLARAPQLGGRSRGGPAAVAYSYAAIAPDGQTIIAQGPRSFVMWRRDLPVDAASTARWLERLTNATLDSAAATVGWR